MRPYQVRASDKLFKGIPLRDDFGNYMHNQPDRDGTAVHIDPGLGKTIIGLTAIVDWFTFGVISRPVLVVAPIKVCETVWRQEALREWEHTRHLTFSLVRGNEKQRAFAMAQRAHVYLINPEGLQWLAKHLRSDWSFFDALIVDESSMFKDNRAKRFRVLSNYGTQVALKDPKTGLALRDATGHMIYTPPHRFKRSGVLTGTPAPSSLMNLWAPIYLVDHGTRLHKKFETYKGRYFHETAQVAEHVFKYELNKDEDEVRPTYQAREDAPVRIHEMIADITVELNAEDYGILPKTIGDLSKAAYQRGELHTHIHYVDLPPALMVQYKLLEKEAIMELNKDVVMAQNGGAKSMMCWQLANGAMYVTDDYGRKEAQEFHDNKLDMLIEVLNTINAPTIVTYYFKHDLARIKERLAKEGIDYAVLAGSKTERTIDTWNAGRTSVLLLHPQSAGHGLNLQFGGHHIVWFTMLWSLERYLQTNARLARSGQTGIVGIHSIIARGTTDELMAINLGENGDDQQRFRSALRSYQQLLGLGLYDRSPFEGLGL